MAVLSLDVNPTPKIGVFCADHENDPLFESLCERYQFERLQSLPASGYVLVWAKQRLALHSMGKGAPGPVQVDWSESKARRRLLTTGRQQPLPRAVGFKPGFTPSVLDATAGLGQDAFVLAWLGAGVTAFERSPVAAALLEDGLRRALLETELHLAAARMQLLRQDALTGLKEWPLELRPDAVYLDPMYPDTGRTALSGKNMQAFHVCIGEDLDADGLLDAALKLARRRVVVKRPKKAGFLAGEKPFTQLLGESTRYDIYMILGASHAAD